MIVIMMLSFAPDASSEMVISHPAVEIYQSAPGHTYEVPLIVLALEKTKGEYGEFRLNKVDPTMTHARLIEEMRRGYYPNLVRSLGYSRDQAKKGLEYIRFPIYLGLLGFRTCFTNRDLSPHIENVTSLAALGAFTQGIGIGWAEELLFRHNGIKVVKAASVKSLFHMTAKGRIDLFCRGASEVKSEFAEYKYLKNLVYDKSIALYYPMPVFLYTNKSNTELIERLTKGLELAYVDGSMQKLWEKNFKESFSFQELHSRRIIRLENPVSLDIDFNYEKYFYYHE